MPKVVNAGSKKREYAIHIRCRVCDALLYSSESLDRSELLEAWNGVVSGLTVKISPCKWGKNCRSTTEEHNFNTRTLVFYIPLESYIPLAAVIKNEIPKKELSSPNSNTISIENK
jgi:hypothetical protein